MSYEGFTEYLDADGFYYASDAYDAAPKGMKYPVLRHSVDCTNGECEDDIDGTTCGGLLEIGFIDIQHQDYKGNIFFSKKCRYTPAKPEIWGRVEKP